MAAINKTTLLANINTEITTNGANEITGEDLRLILIDLVDSGINKLDEAHLLFRNYDPTKAYTVGLPCIFSGTIYQCNTATSGTFTPAHWTAIGGGGGGGATNLSYTPNPTQGQVNSDTGTNAIIPLVNGTNAGLISPTNNAKIGTNETNISTNTTNISANTSKVSADGTVGTHSDVDITGIMNGQAITWNGTQLVPTTISVTGGLAFKGVWNANTNTPTLSSGSGTNGDYYRVSVDGLTNLDGITDWKVGDHLFFDGTVWVKIDNTDQVSSVNGQQGAVVLNTDNISEGSTNEYYTEAKVSANASVAANTAKVSASLSINTHSDVDTTTSAPSSGHVLTWDGSNFVPQAPSGGIDPYTTLTYGATTTIPAATSTNGQVTLTGDTVIAVTGTADGMSGELLVIQDGTGGHSITGLPAGSKIVESTPIANLISPAANDETLLSWRVIGSTVYWDYGKNFG